MTGLCTGGCKAYVCRGPMLAGLVPDDQANQNHDASAGYLQADPAAAGTGRG